MTESPSPPPPPRSKKTGKLICCQCQDDDKDEDKIDLVSFGCNHMYCIDCLRPYFDEQILKKKRSFVLVSCDWNYCKQKCPVDVVQKYCSPKCLEFIRQKISFLPPVKPSYTLKDFGYRFVSHGNFDERLTNINDNSGFYFINERYYDALGECVVDYIQKKMKKKYKMVESFVNEGVKRNNIFYTDIKEYDKLLIIVQGSGLVRPGQWARALCFNDTLKTGACLEYIDIALTNKMNVVCVNPNLNRYRVKELTDAVKYDWFNPKKLFFRRDEEIVRVKGSETSSKHVISVYDKFIKPMKHIKEIYIVAHSAGGGSTMNLLRYRKKTLFSKLKAIAFTDSVHRVSKDEDEDVRKFVVENAVEWAASKRPLDKKLKKKGYRNCLVVSAGHNKHENTSASAIYSVFKFFSKK